MIRIVYIIAFAFSQLFANNEIEYNISFEYWLNEDLRIFAVDNVITLEVEDDSIYLSSNNWFGETLLDEEIEYDNQPLLENSVFSKILFESLMIEHGHEKKLYDFYESLAELELGRQIVVYAKPIT